MTQWLMMGFQDGASQTQKELIIIHDYIMIVIVVVMTLVGYLMVAAISSSFLSRSVLESQALELVWTVLPALLLVSIALPSLSLLYAMEDNKSPDISIKAVGHQWYWSYEYEGMDWLMFDSYMTPQSELLKGGFRLLEVDNRTVLPIQSEVRVLVSAADVLHSWAVPSLGVKGDAIPGRLNQLSFSIEFPGLYFGQCSEICGANHSFMPIVVEGVTPSHFILWCLS